MHVPKRLVLLLLYLEITLSLFSDAMTQISIMLSLKLKKGK
jgi:hypothetical protein